MKLENIATIIRGLDLGLGYLSKIFFTDISLVNLRKYVTRLVEVGMLHEISKCIFKSKVIG